MSREPKTDWPALIASLPRGLTFKQAAKRLRQHYQTTRQAMIREGYPHSDGRKFSQNATRKIDPATIDWSLSNIAIARKLLVSNERVRQVRKNVGAPLVESRGRPKKVTT